MKFQLNSYAGQFVSTFIVNSLDLDGRSNYLEGALLWALTFRPLSTDKGLAITFSLIKETKALPQAEAQMERDILMGLASNILH